MKQLLFLQTGDFAEAWHRFRTGGAENFRDQRKSVDATILRSDQFSVTVVARCDREYDEVLTPSLRAIGTSSDDFYDRQTISQLLGRVNPELAVVATPAPLALEWLTERQVICLPVFADIFMAEGIREWVRTRRLKRTLRALHAPCIANHGLNASRSLERLGISPERIIPWEHSQIAANPEPKEHSSEGPTRILFVGRITEDKGVGDCITAISALAKSGVMASLSVAGSGDEEIFKQQAGQLGVEDAVTFLGLVSTSDVSRLMRQHDAVVVPSRHTYAEGLPNTVFEALASRTALIASDHPAFAPRLSHGVDSLLFRAGDPNDLAAQIIRLQSESSLYAALSKNGAATLSRLSFGIEREALVDTFLQDPRNEGKWVEEHSLSTLLARQ